MTVFDRIISGQLRASFVWQDDVCVAFMDINPMSPGHVLVVPRCSVPTLEQLDRPTRDHLWQLALRIGCAQQRALGSRAQHLLINDGRAASQTVPHVHVHVIPRYGSDTVRALGRMLWHVTTLAVPRSETVRRRRKLDHLAAQIVAGLT